ncbi:MAG: AMP-binding protein [Solirubrobacteraceae bacterium]
MDFATVVRQSARNFRSNTAVWFEGREASYAELYDRACRLAAGLAQLGVQPQDRVAVLADNRFETVEIACACALGNTPVATLYTYYTGETNAYLLDHLDARVLIVDARLLDRIEPWRAQLDGLQHVIVMGGEAPAGTIAYDDLLASAPATDPRREVRPDDVHIIRFSSGTTGRPKAMFHTVERWMTYNHGWRWATPTIDERDSYLAAGSLAHLAVAYLWGMLACGASVSPMASFDPARFAQLVEERRATYATMVPTMIAMTVEEPSAWERDLSSLRCLTYAGSPIASDTLTRAIELFGDCLHQMYAQSEVAPVAMLLPHQHRPNGSEAERRRLRSVGRAQPMVEISIVDDDGKPVPDGEIGEVAVRSPGAMSGIWNDPDATAERLLPDGSVLTRDMGRLDEDGFLYLADRKDDMIITGGYNVWPLELEEALLSHAAVADACVIGVPDPRWGETPKAVVVLDPGATIDPATLQDELVALTREKAGPVKKVTSVEIVDALPRSATGKLQRSVVREPYWADATTRVGGA